MIEIKERKKERKDFENFNNKNFMNEKKKNLKHTFWEGKIKLKDGNIERKKIR